MGLKSGVCGTASAKSGSVTNHGRVWVIGRIPSYAGCSGSGRLGGQPIARKQ